MEAIATFESSVAILRAIARTGFAYGPSKALCGAARWTLVDDEPDLGYVRYSLYLADDADEPQSLTVLIGERNITPLAFVPLFSFDKYGVGRGPFDAAFHSLVGPVVSLLGEATRPGEYSYPHRAGWRYSFAGWGLPDTTFVLIQDELDIQFGMDVTLWVQLAGSAVEVPIRCE